jgi:peptidyl-prolyl cis-trans isomerase SurA
MCFKPTKALNQSVILFFFLVLVLCYSKNISGWQEVVDRIVAVVNDEVITLTDLNLVKTFGLYEGPKEEQVGDIQTHILDQLISQKLIIQLTSESIMLEEEEIELALSNIIQRMEPGEAERALIRFGLDWDDLKDYLREMLMYQKIISERFDQSVIVRLEEIEIYYEQIYIPSRRNKGLDPEPLTEMLEQIEKEIKREKVERQVHEWINNLKREANIQIKDY